jgi:hypothetical protein
MSAKGWLREINTAHNAQQDWLAWLRAELPEELRAAPVNVIPKGSELVVLAASAAWSSRLRYALAAMEAGIRAREPLISKVSVRVAPPGS